MLRTLTRWSHKDPGDNPARAKARMSGRRLAATAVALVPAVGLFAVIEPPAFALGAPQISLIAGDATGTAPTPGSPAAAGNIKITVAESAVDPINGDVAVIPSNTHYLYLVAGATENEFGLSMTAGSAYVIAGSSTVNGATTFGGSALSTAVTPTSVGFDRAGDLLVGDNNPAAVALVAAKTNASDYGQSVTAGDIYELAAPAGTGSVIPLPETAGQANNALNSLAVDAYGNIFIGEGSYGIIAVNEQSSSLTEFGQTIAAGHAAFVEGGLSGSYPNLANAQSATANGVFGNNLAVDGYGNLVFLATQNTGVGSVDSVWVLPAASGTFYGETMTAGHMYWIAGVSGGTPPEVTDGGTMGSGVAALSASLQTPLGIAVDAAGNILVGDNGQSYAVSVIAESASAQYNISSWTAGDLYTISGGQFATATVASGNANAFKMPPVFSVGYTQGDVYVAANATSPAALYQITQGPATTTLPADTSTINCSTTAGSASGHLNPVTDSAGTPAFTTTSGNANVTVSNTGAVSVSCPTWSAPYSVSGTDSDTLGNSGTWSLTVVPQAGTLTQTGPTSPASITTAQAYSGTLTVSGNGAFTVTYAESSCTFNGTPQSPCPISFNGTTGALSAAANTLPAGAYVLTGTDADTNHDAGSWTVTVNVTAVTGLTCTPTAASVAAGAGYTGTLSCTGAVGTTTFSTSVTSPNVTVSGTGHISAAAADPVGGPYTVSGTFTDSLGNSGTWSFALTVTSSAISCTPASASIAANAGTGYSGQLSCTGGTGPYSFSTGTANANVTVSGTGAIHEVGAPAVGAYTVSGTVTDSLLSSSPWSFTLNVTAGPIAQTGATSGNATYQGTATPPTFAGATLTFSGNVGAVSCTTTSSNPNVSVSSGCAVTVVGIPAIGSYTVSGTSADPKADAGTWTFTLNIIPAGVGEVTGTVDNPSGPSGLANICVYLYATSGPNQTTASYSACSVLGGGYQVENVTPGNYYVAFADPNHQYLTQWWAGAGNVATGGAPSEASPAVQITVNGNGAVTSGINADMQALLLGQVSGTVKAGTTGIVGACIYLYASKTAPSASFDACTSASTGSYTVYDVTSGNYYVAFADPAAGYATQWWNGTVTASTSGADPPARPPSAAPPPYPCPLAAPASPLSTPTWPSTRWAACPAPSSIPPTSPWPTSASSCTTPPTWRRPPTRLAPTRRASTRCQGLLPPGPATRARRAATPSPSSTRTASTRPSGTTATRPAPPLRPSPTWSRSPAVRRPTR